MIAAAAKNARLWARDELNWYVEPERATEALLTVESFHGRVWDPACGGGNIPRVMRRHGVAAFGSDVVNRGLSLDDGWLGEIDFLAHEQMLSPNIVCNPPFFRARGAEAFIRQALEVATCKVCMFVDIRFVAGAERASGLFQDKPPDRIWIVTPRVSCPPGTYLAAGNKAGNGSSDWCWLVWNTGLRTKGTQLGWLRKGAE